MQLILIDKIEVAKWQIKEAVTLFLIVALKFGQA